MCASDLDHAVDASVVDTKRLLPRVQEDTLEAQLGETALRLPPGVVAEQGIHPDEADEPARIRSHRL